MLLELSEGLLATLELQEVMDRAAETAARVLRAEVGVVTLPDEAGQELVFRAVHGWEKELVGRIRVGLGPESAGGYSLLSRSPVVVDDVPGDPRFPPAPFLLEK